MPLTTRCSQLRAHQRVFSLYARGHCACALHTAAFLGGCVVGVALWRWRVVEEKLPSIIPLQA